MFSHEGIIVSLCLNILAWLFSRKEKVGTDISVNDILLNINSRTCFIFFSSRDNYKRDANSSTEVKTYASKNDLCEGIADDLKLYHYANNTVTIFIRDKARTVTKAGRMGNIVYERKSSKVTSSIPSPSLLRRLYHVVYLEETEIPNTFKIKNLDQLKIAIENYIVPDGEAVAEVQFSTSRDLPASLIWCMCKIIFNTHNAFLAFTDLSVEDIVLIDGEPKIKESVEKFQTSNVKHFKKNFDELAVILENYERNFCLSREQTKYFSSFIDLMTSRLQPNSLKKRLRDHPLVQSPKRTRDCMWQASFIIERLKDLNLNDLTTEHKNIIFYCERLRSRCQEAELWRCDNRIGKELREILDNSPNSDKDKQEKNYREKRLKSDIITLIINSRNIVRCVLK